MVPPASPNYLTVRWHPSLNVNFHYQSHAIDFDEWLSLITLCFLPLIAHVLVGIPSFIVFSGRRPHWTDKVLHFNPTSILWRYYAITDRRARATGWTPADLAASNAAFWDGNAFNGSEEMMIESRAYCLRTPRLFRAKVLSPSGGKTLLVTLQGMQALWVLIHGATKTSYGQTVATNTIFLPVAVFGLFRLPAAFWLVDDYTYADIDTRGANYVPLIPPELSSSRPAATPLQPIWPPHTPPEAPKLPTDRDYMDIPLRHYRSANNNSISFGPTRSESNYSVSRMRSESNFSMSVTRLLDQTHFSDLSASPLRPQANWRSYLVRGLFLGPMTLDLLLALLFLTPITGSRPFTATGFTGNVMYIVFLAVTLGTMSWCIWKRQSNTTILPVIHTLWYKTYSFTMVFVLILFVIFSMLETRRTACGLYTVEPPDMEADEVFCGYRD